MELPDLHSSPETWDAESDVLVHGFGGADACVALETLSSRLNQREALRFCFMP